MSDEIVLRIGHLPWRYGTGHLEIPGIRLVEGLPWELRLNDRAWRLEHVRPQEGPRDPAEFAAYAKALVNARGSLPLVLGPYLREDTRRALEAEGVSYFDFHGNAHLEAPGLLVHVRMPISPEGSRTLGIVGVRGVQTMLTQPDRAWGVTDLAREASVSAGQAQNVMKALEAESLVITEGKGPAKKRRISDRGRFLDWLNEQLPGRTPRGQLSCSLYGRTPDDLWRTVGLRLQGIEYAITGAAAASILGAGATSLPRTVVRIAAGGPLRHIADRLQAKPTDRGANVILWSDTGRLGTTGAFSVEDKVIAPPVRVYIDLQAELRGDDLAGDFRERVLGY